MLIEKKVENMNAQILVEEKHVLLKTKLDENLRKKQALESKINRQFKELKKLEILLEKSAYITLVE